MPDFAPFRWTASSVMLLMLISLAPLNAEANSSRNIFGSPSMNKCAARNIAEMTAVALAFPSSIVSSREKPSTIF
jgi:hypothetical protein